MMTTGPGKAGVILLKVGGHYKKFEFFFSCFQLISLIFSYFQFVAMRMAEFGGECALK